MSNYNPEDYINLGFDKFSPVAAADLLGSGLNIDTVDSAKITMFNISGKHTAYRIPYFNLEGNVVEDFYRVKNVVRTDDVEMPKYTQPQGAPNYLYFPPNFMPCYYNHFMKYLFVVEGEKKALALAQNGFPAVGIGGIWNWRTDVFGLNGKVAESLRKQLAQPDTTKVYLKWSDIMKETSGARSLAKGFTDLAEIIRYNGTQVILMPDLDCYKDDPPGQVPDVKANVFDAFVDLAMEFYIQGADDVVMARAPLLPDGVRKWAIDDAFRIDEQATKKALLEALENKEYKFPVSKSIKRWLAGKIYTSSGTLPDFEVAGIAKIIITYYGMQGHFYKDADVGDVVYIRDNILYTLDPNTKHTDFISNTLGQLINTELELKVIFFGGKLTKAIIETLANLDVENVITHKLYAHTDDAFYIQLSNQTFLRVTHLRIQSVTNGTDNILFRQLDSEDAAVDYDELKEEIRNLSREDLHGRYHLWEDFLESTTITYNSIHSRSLMLRFFGILFRVSPWLMRWRGTQFPLEWVSAEAGSGKTTLYNLRQMVLTGSESLHATPTKLEELRTLLTNSSGMCVLDNAGVLTKEFSNELARIITDPKPKIRLRKLYTTNTLYEAVINCGIAITSIVDTVREDDLMQRSVTINMRSRRTVGYKEPEIAPRVKWLAEEVVFMHQFLKYVDKMWDDPMFDTFDYSRLKNFAKVIYLGGRTLGIADPSIKTLLSEVKVGVQVKIVEGNYAYEVLRDAAIALYDDCIKTGRNPLAVFTTNILIQRYIDNEEGYAMFESPKKLHKFIKQHETDVQIFCYINVEEGKRLNGSSNTLSLDPAIITALKHRDKEDE